MSVHRGYILQNKQDHIIERHIDLWSLLFTCKIDTHTHTQTTHIDENDATAAFFWLNYPAGVVLNCISSLLLAPTSLFVSHEKVITYLRSWIASRG